ncbi:MAG: cell wall anchor protein, partial [Bacteroidota bacterium]
LPYLLLIGVLAILAAGGYYAWKRWKRRPVPVEPQVVHIVPPHEEALAALRILEEKKLWQQGKVKEFYSEVTEIVRRYLSARFSILALEMTSDEILQQLKRVPQAQTALKNLQSFLTTADLVKFAKYRPTPEEHSHEMELAYAIVRSMVPRTESVPTEEKVMADAG